MHRSTRVGKRVFPLEYLLPCTTNVSYRHTEEERLESHDLNLHNEDNPLLDELKENSSMYLYEFVVYFIPLLGTRRSRSRLKETWKESTTEIRSFSDDIL